MWLKLSYSKFALIVRQNKHKKSCWGSSKSVNTIWKKQFVRHPDRKYSENSNRDKMTWRISLLLSKDIQFSVARWSRNLSSVKINNREKVGEVVSMNSSFISRFRQSLPVPTLAALNSSLICIPLLRIFSHAHFPLIPLWRSYHQTWAGLLLFLAASPPSSPPIYEYLTPYINFYHDSISFSASLGIISLIYWSYINIIPETDLLTTTLDGVAGFSILLDPHGRHRRSPATTSRYATPNWPKQGPIYRSQNPSLLTQAGHPWLFPRRLNPTIAWISELRCNLNQHHHEKQGCTTLTPWQQCTWKRTSYSPTWL